MKKKSLSKGDKFTVRIPKNADDKIIEWLNNPSNIKNLSRAVMEAILWKADIETLIKNNSISISSDGQRKGNTPPRENTWENYEKLIKTINR